MPIPFRDFLTFPFNNGKGIRTSQLDGEFVKSLVVEGETLVAMVQKSDGTEEMMRFVGVTSPDAFTRRLGYSADTTFTAAEVLAGSSSNNETITFPAQGVLARRQYAGVWIPADKNEVTFISLASAPTVNRRYDYFSAPVALEVSGDDGYLYRSSRQFDVSVLQNTNLVIEHQSGFPVYLRRSAAKTADEAFTAADFTGTSGITSTDKFINAPTLTATSYIAFAVPDNTPDITSLLQGGLADHFANVSRQAGTIDIAGVDYKVWVSNDPLDQLLGGLRYEVVQ